MRVSVFCLCFICAVRLSIIFPKKKFFNSKLLVNLKFCSENRSKIQNQEHMHTNCARIAQKNFQLSNRNTCARIGREFKNNRKCQKIFLKFQKIFRIFENCSALQ